MKEKDYIVIVESFDWKNGNKILPKTFEYIHSKESADYLMYNLPFTLKVSKQELERVKNDLEIAGAIFRVERNVKDTLKNKIAVRNSEPPMTYSESQNTAVSEETLAIKKYLKDVYLLERQLYTYEQISNEYERVYEQLNYQTRTLYKYETFRGEISNRSDNCEVFDPKAVERNALHIMNHIDSLDWLPDSWHDSLRVFCFPSDAYFKLHGIVFIVCAIVSFLLTKNIIAGVIIGAVAWLITSVVSREIDFKYGEPKRCKDLLAHYEELYNKALKEKEIFTSSKIKLVVSEYQKNIVPNLNATQELLKKIYSANIIHPKYRKFIAVAQIYEYFETGRCSELEGPHGAYNLYENELRLNTIIDKLDVIVWELERLNSTMSMVVSAIDYSNRMLSNISAALDRIEANTALTAYNTQCIAFNTELSSRY